MISIHQSILLADMANWKRMGDRFSGSQAGTFTTSEWLLLAAVGIGAAILIAVLMLAERWQRPSFRYDQPLMLFRELCTAHHLGWRDRKLLKQLADSQKFADPARLFVSPDRFHLDSLPATLSGRSDDILRLRQQIFGETS